MHRALELEIEPRLRDIGGFAVRRVLPWVRRRHVGPFVFLDHMGPASLAPGAGIDPTYQPRPVFSVVSLGAGDALGRAIYVHDVMLAAALRLDQKRVAPPAATFVTVPDSD